MGYQGPPSTPPNSTIRCPKCNHFLSEHAKSYITYDRNGLKLGHGNGWCKHKEEKNTTYTKKDGFLGLFGKRYTYIKTKINDCNCDLSPQEILLNISK